MPARVCTSAPAAARPRACLRQGGRCARQSCCCARKEGGKRLAERGRLFPVGRRTHTSSPTKYRDRGTLPEWRRVRARRIRPGGTTGDAAWKEMGEEALKRDGAPLPPSAGVCTLVLAAEIAGHHPGRGFSRAPSRAGEHSRRCRPEVVGGRDSRLGWGTSSPCGSRKRGVLAAGSAMAGRAAGDGTRGAAVPPRQGARAPSPQAMPVVMWPDPSSVILSCSRAMFIRVAGVLAATARGDDLQDTLYSRLYQCNPISV